MTTENSWSIVLVPRPLTPFVAFAWYAMSELLPSGAFVRKERFFRWVENTGSCGELYSKHGVVLDLRADRRALESDLTRWLKSPLAMLPNKDTVTVRDFAFQSSKWEMGNEFAQWLKELSHIQNSQVALELSSGIFRKLIAEKVDPRKTKIAFPQLPQQPFEAVLPDVKGVHAVTIPLVKKRGVFDSITEHRVATDFSIKHLPKRNLFRLSQRRMLLAIGGPEGSGKSTLAASLFAEANNIITSLVSDGGKHAELKLGVDIAMLDAGTEVTDAVLQRIGQDRERLKERKRDWTVALARQAVFDAAQRLKTAQLVIADLPGRLTEITELLSAHTTFGGIVTNDWGQIRAWRDYFEDVGVPIVFEMKSSNASSLVTTYTPGRKVMGRIHTLDRVAKGWDSSVRLLAELLMFDILPNMADSSKRPGFNETLPDEDDQQTITIK